MNSRYQPGGDIYDTIKGRYGTDGADRVAQADASGAPGAVADVLGSLKYGNPLETSTGTIFWDQVTTDPLAAPLESANNQIGNAVLGVLKNPWVLLAVGVFVFYQLGGFAWLRRRFNP